MYGGVRKSFLTSKQQHGKSVFHGRIFPFYSFSLLHTVALKATEPNHTPRLSSFSMKMEPSCYLSDLALALICFFAVQMKHRTQTNRVHWQIICLDLLTSRAQRARSAIVPLLRSAKRDRQSSSERARSQVYSMRSERL